MTGVFHYLFSDRKTNPIVNGHIFKLKHRPIKIDGLLKKLTPINDGNDG